MDVDSAFSEWFQIQHETDEDLSVKTEDGDSAIDPESDGDTLGDNDDGWLRLFSQAVTLKDDPKAAGVRFSFCSMNRL
jgi:hypothetical protein